MHPIKHSTTPPAHLPAPAHVVAKRPAHELNDKIVVLHNPVGRFRDGWTFDRIEVRVWAVLNGRVAGHNGEHGQMMADLSQVEVLP